MHRSLEYHQMGKVGYLFTFLIPSGSDDSAYDNARNLEVALSINADCAVLGVAAYRLEFDATVPILTVIPLERNFLSDSCYHYVPVPGISSLSYRYDIA